MDVPFWAWALTIAAIVGMLLFDFVGHVRRPQAPSLRESAIWSTAYVGIAVGFGLLILWSYGADYGGQYFAGLLDRLVDLGYGLAVILGFIGAKLLIHALHTNELPFINGGEHVTLIPEIPTWLSLAVVLGTLLVTTVASLGKSRRDRAAISPAERGDLPHGPDSASPTDPTSSAQPVGASASR